MSHSLLLSLIKYALFERGDVAATAHYCIDENFKPNEEGKRQSQEGYTFMFFWLLLHSVVGQDKTTRTSLIAGICKSFPSHSKHFSQFKTNPEGL